MAENTVKVADLAKVQDVEFATRLSENISKLLALLGASESVLMAPGTQLKIYKTSGTLEGGTVGEAEDIPLSKYENKLDKTVELDFKKWRKQTSMEAIAKRGYEQAVSRTDERMLLDIQKGIRDDFFTFMKTGSGEASGATFQAALAAAWGQLQVKFEDTDATSLYLVNPLDIADYLGTAQVSLQTAFGFTYIENFIGLGSVLVDSKVDKGTVYATAKENLNIYHCDCGSIDGFDFYSDDSGLVGVHHDTEYKNATLETVAVSAFSIFPEYLDRIVKATINPE